MIEGWIAKSQLLEADLGKGDIPKVISVSTKPGTIALHRILKGATSFANDLVKPFNI